MIVAIFITSGIALLARLLPFVFAGPLKRTQWIGTLGQVLPPAIMVLLVAYTLIDRPFLSYPYGIPEIAGIGATLAIHLWRKNMLLSIVSGVAVYQILIHTMEVT